MVRGRQHRSSSSSLKTVQQLGAAQTSKQTLEQVDGELQPQLIDASQQLAAAENSNKMLQQKLKKSTRRYCLATSN